MLPRAAGVLSWQWSGPCGLTQASRGAEGDQQRQRPVTTTVALCCFGVPPGPLVLMIIAVVSIGLPGERERCGSCLSSLLMMCLWSGLGLVGLNRGLHNSRLAGNPYSSLTGFAAKTEMDFAN